MWSALEADIQVKEKITTHLGNRQPEVEGDNSRNTSETKEDSPAEIDVVVDGGVIVDDSVLETLDNTESNKSGSEVSETLSSEDSGLRKGNSRW